MLTAGAFHGTIGNMAPYFASYIRQVKVIQIVISHEIYFILFLKLVMQIIRNFSVQ